MGLGLRRESASWRPLRWWSSSRPSGHHGRNPRCRVSPLRLRLKLSLSIKTREERGHPSKEPPTTRRRCYRAGGPTPHLGSVSSQVLTVPLRPSFGSLWNPVRHCWRALLGGIGSKLASFIFGLLCLHPAGTVVLPLHGGEHAWSGPAVGWPHRRINHLFRPCSLHKPPAEAQSPRDLRRPNWDGTIAADLAFHGWCDDMPARVLQARIA